jgi:regulatory protein
VSVDPFATALRLLTVRDRSSSEVANRLRQKGCEETRIAEVLERCRNLGYLDDARFARQRAQMLRRQGRAVGRRLLADLLAHGVPEQMARDAMAEAGAAQSEREILAGLLRQRFPAFEFAAADDRQRRRVVDFFQRRGFSLGLILDILHGREVD